MSERYFISNAGNPDLSPLLADFPPGSLLQIVQIDLRGTIEVAPILAENVVGEIPAGGFVVANQTEAEAGTNNTKGMTPLQTANAITAQVESKTVALSALDTTKSVTFTRSFTSPVVECWMIPPLAASWMVGCWPVGNTITGAGFTAKFDSPIPGANYLLGYRVTEAST